MKNKVKYVLCPGNVRSSTDDQIHFISAYELARLYKVDIKSCIVFDSRYPHKNKNIDPNLTFLYPKYDGDYYLPIDKVGLGFNIIMKRFCDKLRKKNNENNENN